MMESVKGQNDLGVAILIGLFIIIVLLVLMLPVKGTFAGIEINLPIVGWIGLAAFAIIAFFLYFRHRA
jgi:uncharacterized membrane protein